MSDHGLPRSSPEQPALPARAAWISGLLFLATVAWYSRALSLGFVTLDDGAYVTENRFVQQGLSALSLRWLPTAVVLGTWHPLTMLSHLVDVSLFGLEGAWGHHLTSVLLHAVSVAGVYWWVARTTGRQFAAITAAVVWGWHPQRAESVAWVAERKDVLCGLGFVATLLAYGRWVRTGARRDWWLTGAALVLGLLAKPMLVTAPCVLLLLDAWPLARHAGSEFAGNRSRWWFARLNEKGPWLALVALFCWLTMQTQAQVVATSAQPRGVRIRHIVLAYADYLRQAVWPVDLAVYYPRTTMNTFDARLAAALALLVLASAATLVVARRQPWWLVGWLWYLGMLVPVVGFVQVGAQARADRYTYLPMLGLAVALGMTAERCARAGPRWKYASAALVALLGLACGTSTWYQIGFWRNTESLYARAVAVTGPNVVAQEGLARALIARGALDEGLAHLDQALAIQPDYARAYYAKGYTLAQLGRDQEAGQLLSRAVALGFNSPQARCDCGAALVRSGRLDEAMLEFHEALRVAPGYAPALVGLGNVALARGKSRGAIQRFEEALRLDPSSFEAAERLAWTWATASDATARRPDEALRLADQLRVATHERQAQVLDTWGAALAASGDFQGAIRAAERAVELLAAPHQAPQRAAIAGRATLYRQARPFVDAPPAPHASTEND